MTTTVNLEPYAQSLFSLGGHVELILQVRSQGATPILNCHGHIVCGHECEALDAALARLLVANDRVIVNLKQVQKIDCAGLGVFAAAARRAQEQRKSLELCEVPAKVDRMILLTGLDRVLRMHSRHPMALACMTCAA